jgi:hypothetical protein
MWTDFAVVDLTLEMLFLLFLNDEGLIVGAEYLRSKKLGKFGIMGCERRSVFIA